MPLDMNLTRPCVTARLSLLLLVAGALCSGALQHRGHGAGQAGVRGNLLEAFVAGQNTGGAALHHRQRDGAGVRKQGAQQPCRGMQHQQPVGAEIRQQPLQRGGAFGVGLPLQLVQAPRRRDHGH